MWYTTAAERTLREAQQLVTMPSAGGRYSTNILPDPAAVYRTKESVARAIEGLGERQEITYRIRTKKPGFLKKPGFWTGKLPSADRLSAVNWQVNDGLHEHGSFANGQCNQSQGSGT